MTAWHAIAMPVAVATGVWWLSTGLVLLLDGLPRASFRWSLALSSVLALGAMVGLAHTAHSTSVGAAYFAFLCALALWAWHELSFLTGWVTGPSKQALPAGQRGWPRFRHAVRAILWHELGIVACGVAVLAISWGQPNAVGAWTFLVLWIMRTSAKLNLFLGVRNLSEEWLPEHLAYLGSFFRRRRMNALLPFSILGAGWVMALLVDSATAPGLNDAAVAGLMLTAALLGLAILEHALMVLPLPTSATTGALWGWAMRSPARATAAAVDGSAPTRPARRP